MFDKSIIPQVVVLITNKSRTEPNQPEHFKGGETRRASGWQPEIQAQKSPAPFTAPGFLNKGISPTNHV
jgi:hypothetical protein